MNIEYAVPPEDAMARRVEELEKENAELRRELKKVKEEYEEFVYAMNDCQW